MPVVIGPATVVVTLGLLAGAACAPVGGGGAGGTSMLGVPDGSPGSTDSGGGAPEGADAAPEGPPLAVVSSRTGVEGGTHGGTVVPGTMVTGHFDLPVGGTHASLDGSMRIEIDPGSTTSYFFAQQFWFAGGDGGYMGLQTNGYLDNATLVGKMAIVSIWQAVDSTPGPGASCLTFGANEGQSCRLAIAWQPGVSYRFRVEQAAAGRWTVMLDADGAEPIVVGTFGVPPAWGLLAPTSSVFTMYYGPVAGCASVPLAQARFGDVSADDGAVVPVRVDAQTYGDCAAAATASCTGDACVIR